MGQKTNPIGFRLGVVRGWSSQWYSEKEFSKWLHEDLRLKKFVKEKLGHAGVASVEVERAANKVKINIYTARPGIVIGRRGAEADRIRAAVEEALGPAPVEIDELIRQLGAPPAAVLTVILELELAGRCARQPGNRVCWV